MSTNHRHGSPTGGISLRLPVPATATVGNIVPIGSDGLLGYMKTPRNTTALIEAGEANPGAANGEAVVRLVGVEFVIEVETDDAFAIGDAVYTDGEGDYEDDEAFFCGYAVSVTTGGEGESLYLAVTTGAGAGS